MLWPHGVEMPYFSLVNYVEFVQRFKCISGLYVYKYIYIPGSSFVAQFWGTCNFRQVSTNFCAMLKFQDVCTENVQIHAQHLQIHRIYTFFWICVHFAHFCALFALQFPSPISKRFVSGTRPGIQKSAFSFWQQQNLSFKWNCTQISGTFEGPGDMCVCVICIKYIDTVHMYL